MNDSPAGQSPLDSGGVLDDYVSWQSGGTPSKANPKFWGGEIPWITPKDMKAFDLERTADYLTPAGVTAGSRLAVSTATYVVVRGMILAHTFPVSQVAFAAAFNQDVKAVLPGPELLPRYLAYWFQGHAADFLRLVGESTHGTKKIDLPDLRVFPMAPPARAEQRKLVEILTTFDDQISRAERIIAKLLTVRDGLVERLIIRERPNAILSSALFGPPANGIYKPAHLIGRGVLLVGQTAINADRRVIPSLARRCMVVPTELQRFGLIAGDILVSRVYATLNGVGQPALVEHLGEVSVYESNMMRLRCKRSKADPFFIFQTLLTTSARTQVVRRANLSNQASISQAVLTELPVWLPSIEQQLGVGRAIRSVEAEIQAERASLTKLKAIKCGLLEDLLRGRGRVREGAAS